MKIVDTEFEGLFIIENIKIEDERGTFEKKFSSELLSKVMSNVGESYTSISKKGALRGLHFQKGSFAQAKLVTCLSGAFIDFAVDLRKEQKTFGKVFMMEISSNSAKSIYIPGDFAHGIYAIEDNTILLNYAGSVYRPGDEGGIKWNTIPDLKFIDNPLVSEKDSNLPSLETVLYNYDR